MSAVRAPDAAGAAAVALALFAVYALTAPPTVTLEDDGLFILAALDAGVAHPPGYPLFVLAGHLFSRLPLGTPAYRLHLMSALFGALACAVLYLLGRRLQVPAWAAAAAALGWGLSEHFWSQAIITEVYTLNALLCVATFFFCLQARLGTGAAAAAAAVVPAFGARGDGGLDRRSLDLAALCFGLGLANHWPLMVLALVGFLLLLLPCRRRLLGRLPRLLLIAGGVAALCYLWMWWRSRQPVTAFYGPLEDLRSFWFFISRQGYAEVDASPTAGAADALAYAWLFIRTLLTQVTPAGAALALLGIGCALRNGDRNLAAAAIWIIFAHGPALILLLDFDYEELKIAVFRPYPVTAYGFWALWMGCGLGAAGAWLRRRGGVRPTRLAVLGAIAIPLWLLLGNLRANDRSDDRFAATHAAMVLESLPPDAVFFVFGDIETGPLGYLHFAERVRPDVELLSLQGLVYRNRLFSPLLGERRRHELVWEHVAASSRPVFVTAGTSLEPLPEGFGFTDNGLYQGIEPGARGGTMQLRFDPDVIDYLRTLEPYRHSTDAWIRHARRKIAFRAGSWLGYGALADQPEIERQGRPLHESILNDFHGLLGMAEVLVQYGAAKQLLRAGELLQRAQPLLEERFGKERLGRYHYLQGFLAYRLGNAAAARRHFTRSAQWNPDPENPSIEASRQLQ